MGASSGQLPKWEEGRGSVSDRVAGRVGRDVENFPESGDSEYVILLQRAPLGGRAKLSVLATKCLHEHVIANALTEIVLQNSASGRMTVNTDRTRLRGAKCPDCREGIVSR